jgi:hypothetical protein
MKQSILKYGLIAGIIIVAIPSISGLIMGYGEDTFATGEVVGYSAMIFSLMLIFVAAKKYQEANPNETIGFKKIFLLGTGISLIAGIMFGLYNVIYVLYIDPDFMEKYYQYSINNIRSSGIPIEAADLKIAEIESQKEMFMNPILNFFLMFFTVFFIGLIVSVISGLFQRDKVKAEQ